MEAFTIDVQIPDTVEELLALAGDDTSARLTIFSQRGVIRKRPGPAFTERLYISIPDEPYPGLVVPAYAPTRFSGLPGTFNFVAWRAVMARGRWRCEDFLRPSIWLGRRDELVVRFHVRFR